MTPRVIKSSVIEDVVARLSREANTVLRPDVLSALEESYKKEEPGTPSKKMLKVLLENASLAAERNLAICQDTGMAVVFVEIGRDVVITGASLNQAVNAGIEKSYTENYFRKSVVDDPILRKNTGTNTPAIVHTELIAGDWIALTVMPKGFGSENKGRIMMLNPTAGTEKIVDFCVDTVRKAGPDACPPYILGIGIGGMMEECALLAKKALLRPINKPNPKQHIAELEKKIFEMSNALKIGVMGLGGNVTVMGVNIETGPTHIAGLPVAVNISCHALRSASAVV